MQVIPREGVAGQNPAGLARLAETYAELATSLPVMRKAVTDAGLDVSPEDLKGAVESSADRSGVISITAGTPEPGSAASYSNAVLESFRAAVTAGEEEERRVAIDRINARVAVISRQLKRAQSARADSTALLKELEQLSSRLADYHAVETDQTRTLQRATTPDSAASPKPVRTATLVFVLALLVGSALAYLHFTLSNRFESPEEAARELGLPILAEIPEADPDEPGARDAFRALRTNIEFALRNGAGSTGGAERQDGQARVILVSSPEEQTGKSHVTAATAYSLASEGRRVVAVDTDLRRPSLHVRFNLQRDPGVVDLLRDGDGSGPPEHESSEILSSPRPRGMLARLKQNHVRTSVQRDLGVVDLLQDGDGSGPEHVVSLPPAVTERGGHLGVLTSGPPTNESSEILSSPRLREMLARLKQNHDVVVLDSPPILGVTDAAILSRHVDGVLVVLDVTKARHRSVRRALEELRAAGAPVLGLVANRVSARTLGYGYGYFASEAKEPVEQGG